MYRNPKHKKIRPQKTYLNEIQEEAFLDAADKVGIEPSVLIRECILRVTHFIHSQQKQTTNVIKLPRRASDFIEVNPQGQVAIGENFRLCRAA